MTKSTPSRRRPARHSCIFAGRFVREVVDPRVKTLWESTTGHKAPFGRLRLAFQQEHCPRINPYDSEDCPYREEECAMAFLSAVQNSLLPWITDPAAYFVEVAKSNGIERADNKPLAREMHREGGSSHPGHAAGGDPTGPDRDGAGWPSDEDRLRRAAHRPESIGTLLGAYHFGPRQDSAPDGSTSTK